MDAKRFDAVSRLFRATPSRRGLLALLGGLGVMAFPDRGAAKKKKKSNNSRAQINYCLTNDVPALCDCGGDEFCRQCYDDVSTCCYQYKYSRGAACACLQATRWGSCT